VLFNTQSYADYGKLSRHPMDDMIAGARVDVAPYKKHPADFVLWKPSKPNEPVWESAWGPGRPGWHIECSAMIDESLGLPIDIHGGGVDLIFPHHENEMAQGLCAGHSTEYARYWVHNGFLNFGDEKMSKSLGNVALAHDLLKEAPGEVIRWALLVGHYRAPLEWTGDLLDQSRRSLDRLYRALADFRREAAAAAPAEPALEEVERVLAEAGFTAALDDDINTPLAQSVLFSLASAIRAAMSAKDWAEAALQAAALRKGGELLGVLQAAPEAWFQGAADEDLKGKVEALIAARIEARKAKNFAEADRIRDELTALNVEVMDGPTGATWRIKESG
jgi:cysteinyl-tRNA synthetase